MVDDIFPQSIKMARTCSPDLKNIDPTVICHRNGW